MALLELEKYRKKKKDKSLRYGPFFSLFPKANNLMLPLPKDLVNDMENYSSEHKVSMQSLVLMALRNYLSAVNKCETM